jgi:hypothetical protein
MSATLPTWSFPRLLLLAAVALLGGEAVPAEASAAEAVCTSGRSDNPAGPPHGALFADGWSISRLISGLNNRTRIVQFCVAVMCLALFILCKKLVPSEPAFPTSLASRERQRDIL